MAIVEQAVILAAGRGTRLQRPDPTVELDPETEAIARQGIKALIPINSRAFLDYSIDRLIQAGIRRLCLIIAPDSDPLRAYVDRLPSRFPGLQAECVLQPEAKGTAHALRFAHQATGEREFLMLNSDDLYPMEALAMASKAHPGFCCAVGFDRDALVEASNFEASRVSRLGILVPGKSDSVNLEAVVEKPDNPSVYMVDGSLWVNMNLWKFTPEVYKFCENVAPSPRGEYELTLAVQDLMDSGRPVKMLRCSGGVLDLTSRADILTLRERLAS